MKDLQYHEAANIFPMMEDDEFREFKADIEINGVQHPIELYEGKIIDGRNRYLACLELGIECPIKYWDGDDPIAYVLSNNLHRRQLTASQRAAVIAKAEKLIEKMETEAKEHSESNLKQGSKKPDPVKLPARDKGDTRDKLGKMANVSGSMIDRARKVKEEGVPELFEAVEQGRMSATNAAKLVDEPEEVQREAAKEAKSSGGRYRNQPKKTGTDGRPVVTKPATEAMQIATMVISHLERIRDDDPQRIKAFDKVETWLVKHRGD